VARETDTNSEHDSTAIRIRLGGKFQLQGLKTHLTVLCRSSTGIVSSSPLREIDTVYVRAFRMCCTVEVQI
jgi:hypothetical protein